MLILISSGAQPRYAEDIVRALAHPAGTSFQFRYGTEYVDDRLDASKVSGEPALICYLMADAAAKTVRLVPCRFATVEKAQIVGSSWIFTLNADSFVAMLDDAALRSALSQDECDLIPAFDATGDGPNGKFAFPVTEAFHRDDGYAPGPKAMAAFEETASTLSSDSRFAPGNGLSFFTVVALGTNDRWWWSRKKAPTEIAPIRGHYRLRLGWRYWLDLYSYTPAGGPPVSRSASLTCESSDPAVRFISSASHVLGSRYDLHRSTFTSTAAQMSIVTGLRVSLKIPYQANRTEIADRCDITLEARFRGVFVWTLARIGFIAVGAAAPAAIAAVKADQFTWPLFALMVLGGAIGALGALFPSLKG